MTKNIFSEVEQTESLDKLPVKYSFDSLLGKALSKQEIERLGVVDAKQIAEQAEYSILRASVLLNKLKIYIDAFRKEAEKHCFGEIDAELAGLKENKFERYGATIEAKKKKATYNKELFAQNPEWQRAVKDEADAKARRVAEEKRMTAGEWLVPGSDGEMLPKVPDLNEGKKTFSVSFNPKK